MNGFSHSHYSVPGMFFHHHLPCCSPASAAFDSPQHLPEDHYESASICYGSPASHQPRVAGLKPRNYARPKGGTAMSTVMEMDFHALQFFEAKLSQNAAQI